MRAPVITLASSKTLDGATLLAPFRARRPPAALAPRKQQQLVQCAAAPSGRAGSVAYEGAGRQGAAAFGRAALHAKWWDARRLQQQIQAYGLAGVVAYGLLNTLYYTAAFLVAWVYVFKVPTGLGHAKAAATFASVLAAVWAGSQATKLLRAAVAVTLAPGVDRGLSWLQRALKLKTRRSAFLVVVGFCLACAALLFAAVVLVYS